VLLLLGGDETSRADVAEEKIPLRRLLPAPVVGLKGDAPAAVDDEALPRGLPTRHRLQKTIESICYVREKGQAAQLLSALPSRAQQQRLRPPQRQALACATNAKPPSL